MQAGSRSGACVRCLAKQATWQKHDTNIEQSKLKEKGPGVLMLIAGVYGFPFKKKGAGNDKQGGYPPWLNYKVKKKTP